MEENDGAEESACKVLGEDCVEEEAEDRFVSCVSCDIRPASGFDWKVMSIVRRRVGVGRPAWKGVCGKKWEDIGKKCEDVGVRRCANECAWEDGRGKECNIKTHRTSVIALSGIHKRTSNGTYI